MGAQFFNQEPSGDPDEIANVIRWVRPGNDFSLGFPIFKRGEVNGANRHPLYSFATNLFFHSPLSQEDIRWNFEKILFDKTGQPYRRYAPSIEPLELLEDVEFIISQ